eukprot:6473363-Amphidinium_carterae.1
MPAEVCAETRHIVALADGIAGTTQEQQALARSSCEARGDRVLVSMRARQETTANGRITAMMLSSWALNEMWSGFAIGCRLNGH